MPDYGSQRGKTHYTGGQKFQVNSSENYHNWHMDVASNFYKNSSI